MNKFICDKCGLCCQHLDLNPLYEDLNDGHGVCIHYDKESHLCKIYSNRPDKCNVEKNYNQFKDKMSYQEYLTLNYKACQMLKEGK